MMFAVVVVFSATAHGQLPTGTNWQLYFADEFNGSSLDRYKWGYNYPWGGTLQDDSYESPNNISVGSGLLNITALRDTSVSGKNFSSGAINTSGLENFTYGYIEASIKVPQTLGTWPAFWMLQNGWPPEIDIMEVPESSYNAMWDYWATYHYTGASGAASYGSGAYYTGSDLSAGFHTYGVDWEPNYLKFYFDGNLVYTVTDTSAIAQSANMYLLLDMAVGGWPGEPPSWAAFPTSMQVDWVRVWQSPTSNLTTKFTHAGNGNQNWDTASNWSNGSPQVGSEVAYFGPLANTTNVTLDWNIGGNGGSRTVGGITFDSSVSYTIGWSNKSIMLANTSGQCYINGYADNGQGIMAIGCRLELYNNTIVANYLNNPISLNGNIIGTGQLSIQDGGTVINGIGTYTGATVVAANGNLKINGQINGTSNLFLQEGTATIASGASVTTSSYTSVGQLADNSGTLNISGGLTVNGDFNTGDIGAGVTNIGPGANVQAVTLYVGKFGSANGTLTQTGGTLSGIGGGGEWRIGGGGSNSDSGAIGVYNLQGGLLASPGNFQVGAYGVGTLRQIGGSASVTGWLSIGRFGGGVGLYDMSKGNGVLTATGQPYLIVGEQGSGTLLLGGSATVTANAISVAHYGGTGTVTQSGGTLNAVGGVVFGESNVGGTGTYTLGGGLLLTGAVARTSGTGTFNFSGGTLCAANANATYMQGLTAATVQAGGAVIDSNGYNITIAQPLLHNSTAPAVDGGLTKIGAGTLTLSARRAIPAPRRSRPGNLPSTDRWPGLRRSTTVACSLAPAAWQALPSTPMEFSYRAAD